VIKVASLTITEIRIMASISHRVASKCLRFSPTDWKKSQKVQRWDDFRGSFVGYFGYFEKFIKCRFIVIERSAINLYILICLKPENKFLTFLDIQNLL